MLQPGTCCPTCKLIVPFLRAPRASASHSATSHTALESSGTKFSERCKAVLALLERAGANGMTDDELEEALGGGTSLAPTCTSLRKARMIGWTFREGAPFRRQTRHGCLANVNVMPAFVEETP